jgi:hypothetical protein
MSLVVCDAGPLIALATIGQVDLLHRLFRQVAVSEQVCAEVRAGGASSMSAGMFAHGTRFRVMALRESVDSLLMAMLHAGEASTIALARQEGAALVVMDEWKGRRIARDVYGLQVIGTGRVLVEARHAGLVAEVQPLIEQMRVGGYWMADGIAREILKQAGE